VLLLVNNYTVGRRVIAGNFFVMKAVGAASEGGPAIIAACG
jgi:hypothetical protein